MKEKIQEIQNYFANKIVKGLYRVLEIDEFCLSIIIDRKFRFALWHCNGAECFRTYDGRGNYMTLEFTESEQLVAYKKGMHYVRKWREDTVATRERKQLKDLQEKYPDAK